mgnify:CR=1 FL=1
MGTALKIFFYLEVQNLSSMKYQTEFASGSTMASVKATISETSATNIKTVIAIKKCPIV